MDTLTERIKRGRDELVTHGVEVWGHTLEAGRGLANVVLHETKGLRTEISKRYGELESRGRAILESDGVERIRTTAAEMVGRVTGREGLETDREPSAAEGPDQPSA